ncbi:MAG: hypothetical protein LM590_07410 [Thermofilum sp.]|jgi:hypothetical protein|nr:hypothetical protein [Thermofilum sp.]
MLENVGRVKRRLDSPDPDLLAGVKWGAWLSEGFFYLRVHRGVASGA